MNAISPANLGVGDSGSKKKRFARVGVPAATTVVAMGFCFIAFGLTSPAEALPSFARQTGQPCGTCHTDFPGLTPYGRRFKLGGYTYGGGRYRTSLFPSQIDAAKNEAKWDAGKKSGDGTDNQRPDAEQSIWVPPISMMAIVGYTHTQAPQDPTGSPYKSNDNVVLSPVSLFYGGAITDHIGAFAQVTWNNAPFGAPDQADPYATRQVTWDNTDVRYANTATLGNIDVLYGVTANNSPTVQDPWNTTPAWSFPYAVSNVSPPNIGGTLIEGALAQHAVGAGAYAFINDILYVELSGYRTLSYDAQLKLGPDPFSAPGMIDAIAPYWRIALEPHWGNHWLEFGAFGMSARIHPWNQDSSALDPNGFYQNVTYPQTNRYTDSAVDAQYQYQGNNYWFTLRGTYVHENQTLDASFGNSPTLLDGAVLAANPTDTLDSLKLLASLAYGNDNRVVLTAEYFQTRGSPDTGLYSSNPGCACSPNTSGYVAEIAYIPFISSQAPVWPWANIRVGLQYTYYTEFNGDTVFAHDNNTLFAYLWFAM